MTCAPPEIDTRGRGRPRKDDPKIDGDYGAYATMTIEREEWDRLHRLYLAVDDCDLKLTPDAVRDFGLAKLRLDVFYGGEGWKPEHREREKEIKERHAKLVKKAA